MASTIRISETEHVVFKHKGIGTEHLIKEHPSGFGRVDVGIIRFPRNLVGKHVRIFARELKEGEQDGKDDLERQ